MHLFYCLVVKLFRRFKSLICRRRVCHCLSQHQSTPPPTCSPPLSLLNPLSKYHLPKRCVRERQWPIWGDQDKRDESVKSFLGPFVRYALHLTWPDRYLDCIIRGPSAVFFSTFSPSGLPGLAVLLLVCLYFCSGTCSSFPFYNDFQHGPDCPVSHHFLYIHSILCPGFVWYPLHLLHS